MDRTARIEIELGCCMMTIRELELLKREPGGLKPKNRWVLGSRVCECLERELRDVSAWMTRRQTLTWGARW